MGNQANVIFKIVLIIYYINFHQLPSKLHEKVEKAFRSLDTNNSGTIDRNEAQVLFSEGHFKGSNVNIMQLLQQMDRDGSGSININEWLAFWSMMYKQGMGEEQLKTMVLLKCYFQLVKIIERK